MIATLLLAAGASSRMGARDKLLEEIEGGPILAVLARRALTVGPVFVTVRPEHSARIAALPEGVEIVIAKDAELGMAHSLRAGIAALPDTCTGAMILPADMPDITADDLAAIAQRARESGAPIVRGATEDGKHGHPIYFAASMFEKFADLEGDRGAFRLCTVLGSETEIVTLSGQRARLDLDTPEDWEKYRADLSA